MVRAVPIWAAMVLLCGPPLAVAATSPLLAWRDPPYIASGLAGAAAMVVLLLQPLVAAGVLPGLTQGRGRRLHRWLGTLLLALVAVHVAGLYLTSPPDTLDALLLVSPTAFSVYGVIGLWGLALTLLLVVLRRRLPLRPLTWMALHNAVALVVVAASVVHALLIEGTMGPITKWALCLAALAAAGAVIVERRILAPRRRPGPRSPAA